MPFLQAGYSWRIISKAILLLTLRLESHILPALFGLENKEDLAKLDDILVWDSTHDKVIHEIKGLKHLLMLSPLEEFPVVLED